MLEIVGSIIVFLFSTFVILAVGTLIISFVINLAFDIWEAFR